LKDIVGREGSQELWLLHSYKKLLEPMAIKKSKIF